MTRLLEFVKLMFGGDKRLAFIFVSRKIATVLLGIFGLSTVFQRVEAGSSESSWFVIHESGFS